MNELHGWWYGNRDRQCSENHAQSPQAQTPEFLIAEMWATLWPHCVWGIGSEKGRGWRLSRWRRASRVWYVFSVILLSKIVGCNTPLIRPELSLLILNALLFRGFCPSMLHACVEFLYKGDMRVWVKSWYIQVVSQQLENWATSIYHLGTLSSTIEEEIGVVGDRFIFLNNNYRICSLI